MSKDGENRFVGIGHNRAPEHAQGQGFRQHCWKRARRELLGHVPIEMVRIRMARARELGLAYPQYASILTGTGRDIVAFLFTAEGLHLKLRRQLEMPDQVREKLGRLVGCERLALAPSGETPELFRAELEQVSGLAFAGAGTMPPDTASWPRARQAIIDTLAPLKLPGDAVVLVGTRAEEADWAIAARLARFVPAESYFPIC